MCDSTFLHKFDPKSSFLIFFVTEDQGHHIASCSKSFLLYNCRNSL